MPSLLCIPVVPVPTVSELNFLFDFLFEGFKGIVSRDWGALQIILLDRYIVGSISAEGYF